MYQRHRPRQEPVFNQTWVDFLQGHLDNLGWNNAALADRATIDRSLVGRWLNEGKGPSIESVRGVCRALRVDIRQGLVAAGYFTKEELMYEPKGRPDLSELTDKELLEEIELRMSGRRKAPSGPQKVQITGVLETVESSTPEHNGAVVTMSSHEQNHSHDRNGNNGSSLTDSKSG